MKKRRTRQHLIEDLGLNYIERQCLYAGFSVHRIFSDYGYDANVFTYNDIGEAENGMLLIQLKSTDNLKTSTIHDAVEFSLSRRDLELWLLEREMVLLLIYDAVKEKAYYLILQEYFKDNRLSLKNVRKFIKVYLPMQNVLNRESVKEIQLIKNLKYNQDDKGYL